MLRLDTFQTPQYSMNQDLSEFFKQAKPPVFGSVMKKRIDYDRPEDVFISSFDDLTDQMDQIRAQELINEFKLF